MRLIDFLEELGVPVEDLEYQANFTHEVKVFDSNEGVDWDIKAVAHDYAERIITIELE